MNDDEYMSYKYGGYRGYNGGYNGGYRDIESGSGGYSGNYYSSTNSVSSKRAQKEKEMKANIPARTSMLKELFDNDHSLSHLPKLPLELWNIVAEYEGGVESSVLGDNVTSTSSWSWCSIV